MKSVWGLGAAVLSVLLILLFWTSYVTGRLATAEQLAPSETAEGIEVPVIGTVGDFPDPERRIIVNVTADGRISVGPDELSFDAFAARMQRLRDERDAARATTNVIVRADGRLPWGAAVAVSHSCPAPVWFAVRHEGDGEEGAVLAWPASKADEAPPEEDHGERFVVRRIHVYAADGEGTPSLLYADMRRTAEPTVHLVARLDADPSIPVGVVLSDFDALLRAGAADVELAAQNPRRYGDMRDLFTGYSVAAGASHRTIVSDAEDLQYVRINGSMPVNADRKESHEVTAGPGSQAMPPCPRVRGGPAGPLTPPRAVVIDTR